MKKVLSRIFTGFLVIILVLVAILSVQLIITSNTPEGASVFGYHPMVVLSDSMEPTIMTNDMIIVKETKDAANLKKGDIISFWGSVEGEPAIISHRIHEVLKDENGNTVYHTIGDNNNGNIDQSEYNANRQDPVTPDKIVGVYTGIRIANYKDMILYCLVIPIAIIFVWQLINVIRLAMIAHREKQVEMVQAEKDRVIEEYLRQQQEQAAQAAETPAQAPAQPEQES